MWPLGHEVPRAGSPRSTLRGQDPTTTTPASVYQQAARLNKFIEFLKGVRAEKAEKAAGEAKKAEAKATAKAKAEATAAEVLSKKVEPTFASLEEALEAGQECKKCLPTTKGTKGCRACMGEWFEMIRIRKT